MGNCLSKITAPPLSLEEELLRKLLVLNETAWENRVKRPLIIRWLENFNKVDLGLQESQRIHALFLLSQFVYFGSMEMRELLKAMYRDLYKYPIVERIRKENHDTTDCAFIEQKYQEELLKTRFLGIGNPSESGCHLLYYFRQENGLSKRLFIHGHEIFKRAPKGAIKLRSPDVVHYVFIDDLRGSGDQGKQYSDEIVSEVKNLRNDVRMSYLVLFATAPGKRELVKTKFDDVRSVVELDESFRVFGHSSRYFKAAPEEIDKTFAKTLCGEYGRLLCSRHPFGYRKSQLLLGFHHNTPDNTLPIMWCDEPETGSWTPIFRRYPKFL
jgi:hypothetical protein